MFEHKSFYDRVRRRFPQYGLGSGETRRLSLKQSLQVRLPALRQRGMLYEYAPKSMRVVTGASAAMLVIGQASPDAWNYELHAVTATQLLVFGSVLLPLAPYMRSVAGGVAAGITYLACVGSTSDCVQVGLALGTLSLAAAAGPCAKAVARVLFS